MSRPATYSATRLRVGAGLPEVVRAVGALQSAVAAMASVPGVFTPQRVPHDVVVGDGYNWLTVGTVTVPAGVTVTVRADGTWGAL